MDEEDKTDWYDPDVPPVHNGPYEWESPEQFFQGAVSIEWRTRHWIVHWNNGVTNGSTVMAEAPCRWRGSAIPPASVLLEM